MPPVPLTLCSTSIWTLLMIAPAGMRLKPMTSESEFGAMLTGWTHVREHAPDWPHLAETTALAARHGEVLIGDSLVHTDARDDNFLLTASGAMLCDWNWPVLGPSWVDTVLLLISAFGDGLDADGILESRRLTKDVSPEHIDVLLALVCGYFLESRDRPVPNSSPYIRVHSRWYSEVTWTWLARRRGWG